MEYELDGKSECALITEFIVDGIPLSSLLGVPRDLGSCGCSLDPSEKSVLPSATQEMIETLIGKAKPSNQFRTDRIVLYRCHCGCDYCGVVSCRLIETENEIEWHDISFEDDSGPAINGESAGIPTLSPIPKLTFNKRDYIAEILRFDQVGA